MTHRMISESNLHVARKCLLPVRSVGTLAATDIDGTTATYNHLNFFTDFENGLPAQFSGTSNSIESVQGYDQVGDFSGSFLRNSSTGNPAAATTVTFTDLAPHEYVNLDFLLAIIDSWNGNGDGDSYGPDYFNVSIDGVSIFSENVRKPILNDTQSYQPPAGVHLGSGDYGFYSSSTATPLTIWVSTPPLRKFRILPAP